LLKHLEFLIIKLFLCLFLVLIDLILLSLLDLLLL
jgi:hypothetical protein